MKQPLAAVLLALLVAVGAWAQHAPKKPATPPAEQQASPAPAQNPPGQATVVSEEQGEHAQAGTQKANSPAQVLAHTSEESAEGDETIGFKHSPVVRWISHSIGISTESGYWVLYSLDFAIIAVLIGWVWKKNIPAAFRTRTASIRKTMDEAQAASADANRRLSEIEARLSKLDQEIVSMRSAAESEAQAEEARIRAAAEEDSRKIVDSAQAEIESATRVARRELKAYAADLAVSLAAQRIHVDAGTDRELVQNFARELGSNNGKEAR